MGWTGYGIYDGDETQTCHFRHLEWVGLDNYDEVCEWMQYPKGTIIPLDKRKILEKNVSKIIKRMPKLKVANGYVVHNGYFTNIEYDCIEWQMLLALFVVNKIRPPKIIYTNGIAGTVYLMGDHASDFDNPRIRRSRLRSFIEKAKKNGFKRK